ncbi:phosphate ABC transporter permease PstA [Vibrio renipiscarius]|uniref:Phosphate transport system permease protein PstA n=1 Tax=Vibrio renipiscarius TaxID=1461322 RepID=A0A0C2NFA0_9VIBR|nr:phosphate ABC transporter permease PstA [Vibrio renipiscarius]KII76217.1 phosphate ABC transporter permease [Vibrio renipiscarius]KII78261.1 phosphate ABC transporter permease [Vibrio renipiscarius]
MNFRRVKEYLFKGACTAATGFGLVVLISILYTLISNGISGISLAVFTEITPGPGSEGGLKNAIVGSLIMTSIGIAIAAPVGVLAGTWLSQTSKGDKFADVIRFMNLLLVSTPSILVGLFIYGAMVVTMGTYSGIAGAIALAVLALPVIISSTEEMLRLVPTTLKEAGAGLGAPQWIVLTKLCYRAVAPGIITAILLSIARMSGETAPLLFTALNSNYMTVDLSQPMANLPVTIYQFAMSPYESWIDLAWAGALLITTFILILNVLATLVSKFTQATKA